MPEINKKILILVLHIWGLQEEREEKEDHPDTWKILLDKNSEVNVEGSLSGLCAGNISP